MMVMIAMGFGPSKIRDDGVSVRMFGHRLHTTQKEIVPRRDRL